MAGERRPQPSRTRSRGLGPPGPAQCHRPTAAGAVPEGISWRRQRAEASGHNPSPAQWAAGGGKQTGGEAAGVCLPAPQMGEEGQANRLRGVGKGTFPRGLLPVHICPGSGRPFLVLGCILAKNQDTRRRWDPPPTAPSPFSRVQAPKFWREGTLSSPETEPWAGGGAGQRGQRSLRARKTPISAIRRNKRHAGFGVTPWYVPADR